MPKKSNFKRIVTTVFSDTLDRKSDCASFFLPKLLMFKKKYKLSINTVTVSHRWSSCLPMPLFTVPSYTILCTYKRALKPIPNTILLPFNSQCHQRLQSIYDGEGLQYPTNRTSSNRYHRLHGRWRRVFLIRTRAEGRFSWTSLRMWMSIGGVGKVS